MISMDGFVAKPQYAKKKRGEQFFFVNNRYVKSPYLNSCSGCCFWRITGKRISSLLLFIFNSSLPDSIDINIHPTKTEIKFEDEKAIYAILRATVKHSLGQYNIAPILDFNRDATLDTPL